MTSPSLPATTRLGPLSTEPATLLGFVQAAVVLLVVHYLDWSEASEAGLAAFSGAVLAAVGAALVRPWQPAALFGVVQTAVPLVVLLWWPGMPPDAGALVVALAATLLGVGTRQQVTPPVSPAALVTGTRRPGPADGYSPHGDW